METDQKRFVRKTFNDEFMKFVNEVHSLFPDDKFIKKSRDGLELLKKANPKLVIKIWKEYIVDRYISEIEKGELDFFINKDYNTDVSQASNANTIIESINRLREPVRNMGESNQATAMKYIQQLSKLCQLYFT